MLKNRWDIFREIIMISILFHFVLTLYNFWICWNQNAEGIEKILIIGCFILSLTNNYLLQFFLWTPIRQEKYVEGKQSYFLLWTISIIIWTVGFSLLKCIDFIRVIPSGIILLLIYTLIRYKNGIYVGETELVYGQLKEDMVSILFLTITQFFLSSVLAVWIGLEGINLFLMIAGNFIILEMIVCYLNIKLRRKIISAMNLFLVGVFCFIVLVTMIYIEQESNWVRAGWHSGLFLGWCICISQVKTYQNIVERYKNDVR